MKKQPFIIEAEAKDIPDIGHFKRYIIDLEISEKEILRQIARKK